MRSRIAISLGVLLATATSVPALAQSSGGSTPYPAACAATTVSQGESEKAHAIYSAGKVQYDDGNYDAAIAQFRDAYRRDCSKHDLLIIISRAYELKGDRAEAVRALETYLEREPRSPDAATHRNRIENLKKQIAAQPPPTVTPPPPTATATVTPPPPAVETREHTVPPWIVVGLGGAAVVAGAVVIATAPKLPTNCVEATETCQRLPNESEGDFKDRQQEAGRSKTQPVVGGIVIGAGAALVVGGLLWHFLEPTGPVEPASGKVRPKLTPAFAPGYAGMSLGASF